MKSLFMRMMGACACALALVPVSVAQETPTPTAHEPAYVDFKGFATKMFAVTNRDPRQLIPALRLLGSGYKGALMESSSELRTITVRDFPENVASIEEAIKVLDKAEPPRPTIELRLHMLVASNVPLKGDPIPPELEPVVAQLKSTLRYTNYVLVTSAIQRTKSGSFGVGSSGIADFLSSPQAPEPRRSRYEYQIELVTSDDESGSGVTLRRFDFRISDNALGPVARIHTDVTLRDGEKVVVGTAGIVDRGLVLVLSARMVK
jgi:hypothetical protein